MNKMLQVKKWAVLGATDDQSKFGYKILKRLKEKGYTVYGINPKYNEIEGIKVVSSIDNLPEKVDGISVIVNPKIALNSLENIKQYGAENLWFQPGSYDSQVINKAKELGFNIENNNCLYVELGKL
ncbi:MAG: CoA-binding protein [Clostridium argentinense]|nr:MULTISPECIES: CoA-binding protein [Clostridium]MBS5825085.1 CoA-binding protein [Clostridium argentinense]MDU1350929.1 CoA-binding protein [Clostridium argentinense]